MSQEDRIDKIVIEGDTILITDINGDEFVTVKEIMATIYDIEGFKLEGVTIKVESSTGFDWGTILINFVSALYWHLFLL